MDVHPWVRDPDSGYDWAPPFHGTDSHFLEYYCGHSCRDRIWSNPDNEYVHANQYQEVNHV